MIVLLDALLSLVGIAAIITSAYLIWRAIEVWRHPPPNVDWHCPTCGLNRICPECIARKGR